MTGLFDEDDAEFMPEDTGEIANADQDNEDSRDAAIAKERLKGIKNSPKSLISGDALKAQLDDLLS